MTQDQSETENSNCMVKSSNRNVSTSMNSPHQMKKTNGGGGGSSAVNQTTSHKGVNPFQPSSSSSGIETEQQRNRICRDFLQGTCQRKYCRYPHTESTDQIVFCHDFQNTICSRMNCKFLHYTLDEEDYYRKYKKFPLNHNDFVQPTHLNACPETQMYDHCQYSTQKPIAPINSIESEKWSSNSFNSSTINHNHLTNDQQYDDRINNFNSMKRQHCSLEDSYESFKRFREHSNSMQSSVNQTELLTILSRFEEEHNMLRRRVEANEVKIAELRASNDFLLTQNAQFRLSTQQCSRVVNPVTVTTSQPQATQVINGVSIASVRVQATPIVSMSAPQTQIIASSNCTPLTIATNTTQGQQLAQLAQQSMNTLNTTNQPINAAHASQIIGTSQITLTPTLAQAPSMGLAINTSQALAMSNATQPIISYPVMTHSILPH